MKKRDLFVFAGQSNMMGAAVLPIEVTISAADCYEYKHKPRRMGESRGSFMPAPKVDSAVIRIDVRKQPLDPELDEEFFFRMVRAGFSQRRKTLLNSLSTGFSQIPKEKLAEFIAALGLRADIRGEKLTVKQFADLSDLIFAEIKK